MKSRAYELRYCFSHIYFKKNSKKRDYILKKKKKQQASLAEIYWFLKKECIYAKGKGKGTEVIFLLEKIDNVLYVCKLLEIARFIIS